jgi:SAM-dependent methyltransferase
VNGSPRSEQRDSLTPLADGSAVAGLVLRVLDVTVMPAWGYGRDRLIAALERRNRIRTAGVITTSELGTDHPEQEAYDPTPWFTLRRALPVEWVRPFDVFLDLGSGMGRAVYQAAAHYPFRRVIGVEVSGELHEVARANIERNRARLRCQDVELVNDDVRRYRIPDDVTVVYLYNPFTGQTFADVVDRLLESVDRRPRSVRIVYLSPREHERLVATGRVQLVKRLRRPRPVRSWADRMTTNLYDVLPRPDRTGQAV